MIQSWGNVFIDNNPHIIDIKIPHEQVLTIGNCRSYGDVCIANNHIYSKGTLYNRFLDFDKDNHTITVEAGITLKEVLSFVQQHHFVFIVTPGTSFATVGGCIANDVHGKNHETTGSFAESVLEFSLKLPQGDIVTCSRDENSDIFWATIGGIGLTGAILTVKLQLKKVDNTALIVTRTRHDNLQSLMYAMDKFKNAPYCVAWLDTTQKGLTLGRGILEIAHHAHEGIFVDDTMSYKKVPFYAPSWLLNPTTVKIFNHFYYHRIAGNRQGFEEYHQFQYPLDHIQDWNKLYGRQGFYQFQCVVPFSDAESVFKNILSLSMRAGFASPLAVLKRLGKQNEGYLSFPTAGYTLAIDIPARQGAITLIKNLETLVLDAKGRIYPAKDSLMTAESFAMMYPNKDKFLNVLKQIKAKPVSKAAIRYGLQYE